MTKASVPGRRLKGKTHIVMIDVIRSPLDKAGRREARRPWGF